MFIGLILCCPLRRSASALSGFCSFSKFAAAQYTAAAPTAQSQGWLLLVLLRAASLLFPRPSSVFLRCASASALRTESLLLLRAASLLPPRPPRERAGVRVTECLGNPLQHGL